MMEFRNAQQVEGGAIDCEINHPAHGWIPFTAVAGDTGAEFDVDVLMAQMLPAAAEVIPTPQVELDAIALQIAKQAKIEAVSSIKVTTQSGKTFDGDEVSQDRMSRAVTASEPLDTTTWILADNTPTTVTREELKEALRLAGEAQTVIWVVQ